MNAQMPKPPTPPSTANDEAKANALPTLAERRAKYGKRVLCYGDAGVGKSTLFTKLDVPTLYIDLEYTLGDLFDEIPSNVTPFYPSSWDELQKALQSEEVEKYGAVVIDSLTTLESMWLTYALTHCRKAPEGYGAVTWSDKELPALKDEREFGGGGADSAKFAMWTRFENLLMGIVTKGVTVINLCHVVDEERDDASEGRNITHAPRLLNPNNKTGKNSVRKRAIEWHGEVWYMKWETVRKDDEHLARTGKRLILGQPDEENATNFDGMECKSRRGFSKAYLDEFDVNAVLGFAKMEA